MLSVSQNRQHMDATSISVATFYKKNLIPDGIIGIVGSISTV